MTLTLCLLHTEIEFSADSYSLLQNESENSKNNSSEIALIQNFKQKLLIK